MAKKKAPKFIKHTPGNHESQEFKSLWDISRSLHQYLNIDDLISHIFKKITELMAVETISIALHDEKSNELVFCWSGDIPIASEQSDKIRFPADQGIAGSVFNSGKSELILDVAKDHRHFQKIDDATRFKTKSMIAVPLKTKDKTIGILEVLNKRKDVFNKKDLDFLVAISPIIAMALDNARLYTDLDKAHRELQRIDRGKDTLIRQTKHEVALLRREVERHYRFDRIIGNSEPMVAAFKLCERIIDSDIAVLIEGETGTGKELFARTIHFNGPRKNKPFVTQNCGGIPDTLLYSELFGHKKGAFTGALSDKKGLFEMGHSGTVFLDEVADMSQAMQISLLRVLQDGEIKPLGSTGTKKVNIRLISATNKNLEEAVSKGRFREDLFYRVSVFTVKLPPLRQRIGDIPVLANHFIRKFNRKNNSVVEGLDPEALEYLSAYSFPGNVRELENEIERAMAMVGPGRRIGVDNLSTKITKKPVMDHLRFELQGSLKESIEALERFVISQALKKHKNNKTRTARELGLSRFGLQKKMQRYHF